MTFASLGILKMREKGIMDQLQKKYVSNAPARQPLSEPESLTLGQMIFCFIFYFASLGLVFVFLGLEILSLKACQRYI